jgi:exodeoxyribonuclease VII small subunit
MTNRKTANTDAQQSTPGFEDSLAQLETLVSDMEDGNLSLEEALSAFETGIKLTRQCQQALQAAELKVQILSSADGEPMPMDLDTQCSHEAES